MDLDPESSYPPPNPFVKQLDNLAAAAFYNIAIKREESKSLTGPQWFDSVPTDIRYPFSEIRVPKITGKSDAKELSDKIKSRGNDYFKQGEYWEAIWKYEHALFISRSIPDLKDDAALLHCNMAAACLKLGTAQRVELLDNSKFPPSIILWFVYTQQHATEAISFHPPPHILSKAFYRRGESFRVILSIPELQSSIETMCTTLPVNSSGSPSSDTFVQVICDYLKCLDLQKVPDPKIFCDVIMLAVTHKHIRLLPPLLEYHVRNSLPTLILQEMLKREDTQLIHISYLLLKHEIQSNLEPHFEGVKFNASQLMKKKLADAPVFRKLCNCGMRLEEQDFTLAKKLYQKKAIDKALYEFVMSKQKDSPEEQFFKLKQGGNTLFSRGAYDQALGLYYKALNHCRTHGLVEEMAVVRANCAQACLKLNLYSDAYSHADQCLRLNPLSHKGYFRRAEALRAMLDSPQKDTSPPGTYKTVVRDYLESHAHQPNTETFCTAIKLAIDKNLDLDIIPKLMPEDVRSGFSDKVMLLILTLDDITDTHLNFLLFDWPRKIPKPYNGLQFKMIEVAKRARDPKIYKKFFELGLKVTDDLIVTIVHFLTDDCTETLDLILNRIKEKGEPPTMGTFLNVGCAQALADHKHKLLLCMMSHGGKPSRSDLRATEELKDNPVVRRYLAQGEELVDVNIEGQEFSKAIATLNRDARDYFKAGKYPQAIQLYKKALEICSEQKFKKEKATTHANLCLAYLKYEHYFEAYEEASACIALDPKYAKAYYRRAEALKKCADLRKGPLGNDNLTLSYRNVMENILIGQSLEPNPKAFTDAIMVALEQREEHRLKFVENFPATFFSDVLTELVARPDCHQKHLDYTVCKLWSLHKFSAEEISLSRVLSVIGATHLPVIQRLVELGMKVNGADISTAVDVLKDQDAKQLETFNFIATKCPKEHLNSLCERAFKAKKTKFVFTFIECGSSVPGEGKDLLNEAIETKEFITAMDLVRAMQKQHLTTIDLAEIIDTNLVRSPKLIKVMVECGINPNGLGQKSPMVIVLSMEYLHIQKRCEVACVLLLGGADCGHLCRLKKGSTTPLHVATEIALQTPDGNSSLITAVLQSPTFNPKKLTNDKQETPLHIAVKSHRKREPSTNVLKALLEPGIIDPAKKDKTGKRAIDLLSKKDNRVKLLEMAARHYKSSGGQGKKKQRKKPKQSSKETPEEKPEVKAVEEDTPMVVPVKSTRSHPPKPKFDYNKFSQTDKLNWLLERLLSQGKDYFIPVIIEEPPKEPVKTSSSLQTPESSPKRSPISEKVHLTEPSKHLSPSRHEFSPLSDQESDGTKSIFAELGFDLDALPWEVEGTNRVVKFFKDVKKNSKTDRACAARIIFHLAEGIRNKHLATPVSTEPGLSLYEARMTKSARLLWEKAITYSSKLTGSSSTPVYTQIIRVWDIVLDHDALNKKIKMCTEQIESSYRRGRLASVKYTLQPQDSSHSDGFRGRETVEVPMRFLPGDKMQKPDYEFVPAASTKEDEYNITTFVSFDTVSLTSMLSGIHERRDYPFKEWPKEHEIIKLNGEEPILLLGRSGTGKTTCCLYRLWNEYKDYWNPQSSKYNCKLPRRVLVSPEAFQEEVYNSEDEDSLSDSQSSVEGSLTGIDSPQLSVKAETDSLRFRQASTHSKSELEMEQAVASSELVSDVSTVQELIEEDLHQVFVTKNYVLCDQIKKRFFNMVAAHDFLHEHLEYENHPIPNSFTNIENLAFPIFVTARQFYIILDNSLGDGERFFRRDSEGNLAVKITSMDYDHEDAETLLDLEESESEGEEDGQVPIAQGHEHFTGKQHAERWTEVTALYFKELIWPAISHQCHISSKDFDPLLVWIEIQSFIKGSEKAIRKGAALSCSEYLELGNKMAPNFSSDRETIFKLFKMYQLYLQRFRHSEFLFDECDLMHHLYKRLQKVHDVPWSFHSIFIDEVQDFTQAELAILIHCCRDPNSMFFTGDTAQSIMRGIAFRFQDLRSLYHRINKCTTKVKVPQKPYSLTSNFRSHSGILKLAGSVIDLISEFFKDSIDHLPEDEGMFPGPTPVLVESCEVDELALLLSANKREASAIEFGAHQAVIVQSKESKEKLPDILKGAIVLTIFEAKGLEFDDVLLYNFFTDSLVDEKGWRVISSYLEMPCHSEKIFNSSKLPGASADPRSRSFDPKLHKSLNAELKYLYTAITRTKCNLWIYDSNQELRLPMFDYWYKRELVKVVRKGTPLEVEGMYNLVFASNSTTEQWKAQGDNFRKKHLWEQARLCYERAGEENKYLAKEAQAYQLVQNARQQKPSLFTEAALLFLECDYQHHVTSYLTAAAICLRNARPPKLQQAAKLHELLGENGKACQVYLKARDFDSFVRIKENLGEYSSVIHTLLGKPIVRKREALMKAREYEERGIELEPELSASKLSYTCAKFYAERKDKDTLVDVLQYMPEMERKIRFLKEAKLYERAFLEYEQNNQYSDAYRLATAQGWYKRGLELARSVQSQDEIDSFILQRAKSRYKQVFAKENAKGSDKNLTSQRRQEVGQEIIDNLSYLFERGKKNKNFVSTYAGLLLGMITTDKGLCRLAWRTFKHLKHKVGELEAFHQVQELADESTASVLEVCQLAKEVGKTFQSAKDINIVVQQGLKFYDLQKFGQVYCTPRDQDIWIPDIISKCQNETERVDIDGMYRLDVKKVRECISEHFTEYIKHWVNRFQLDTELPYNCDRFLLHKPLFTKRFSDREYTVEEVSSEALRNYIQSCTEYLELRLILDKDVEGLISLLLLLFSPQVTRYLPQRLNEHHVNIIRKSHPTHTSFTTWLKQSILVPAKSFPERVLIDHWLTSWRACCLFAPDMKPLFNALGELENKVNKQAEAETSNFKPPAGFVYKNKDEAYYHVFSIWLLSCQQIRDKCDVLWGSRLAIYHFISEIASSQTISISVANMVDVLSLHSTILLVILTHVQGRQNRPSSLTVPLLYKSAVQLFDSMISDKDSKWKVFTACAHEISTKPDRSLPRYFKDARLLLVRSLEILLGAYKRASWFSVLKFALKKLPHNDATRHCLILTLTIFGNLIMLSDRQTMFEYHQKLLHIFSRIQDKQDVLPDYVGNVTVALNSQSFAHTPREVFGLVDMLLRLKRGKQPLAKLVLKPAGKNFKVDFAPMHTQPPRMRPPPQMLRQQHPHQMEPSLPPTHTQQSVSATSITTPPVQPPIGTGRTTYSSNMPATAVPYPSIYPTSIPPLKDPNWPKILPYESYLDVNPVAQQMGYEYPAFPTEGALGEPMGLPQLTEIPSLSREEMLPTVGAVDPLMPEEEGSDSVSARVVARYSIDQLRQLASSNQASADETYGTNYSNFNFSYDPDLNISTEDQDYRDIEEDRGFEQALSSDQTHFPTLPQVDPELMDPSIVTQGGCSACGENFFSEDYDDTTSSSDLLYAHVTSEAHRLNTILCKRFLSFVDTEESEVSYPKLCQKLQDLITHCEGVRETNDSEKLDKIIDTIKESQEKNDKILTDIQERRAWREGIQHASAMIESMERLLSQGEKLLNELTGHTQHSAGYHREPSHSQDLDTGELDILSGGYEDSKVTQGTEVKKLRSAAEKQVSRQRKRERKERLNRGASSGRRK